MNIWVFDIDGVITDPITKKIAQPRILDLIVGKLRDNGLVVFNTGRSAKWLGQEVVKPLRALIRRQLGDYSCLSNLICVCEMGNVIVEYDKKGQIFKKVLNSFAIPEGLKKTIRDLVAKGYSDSMFVDETKEVILTIEMRDGYSLKQYQERQAVLHLEISKIMVNYYSHLQVRPSSTNIAIDVKPIESSKSLGAKRIISLCMARGIRFKQHTFVCFGDSLSDVEMSDYLYSKNISTELVFVGPLNKKLVRKYPIHLTKKQYSAGTLEYLTFVS